MSTCSDCEHYEAINGRGECKAIAPEISPTSSGTDAVWPVVHGDQDACHCGGFTVIEP